MQKSMKRLLSIILSFTMLFSSNCIAYGADEENVNNREIGRASCRERV